MQAWNLFQIPGDVQLKLSREGARPIRIVLAIIFAFVVTFFVVTPFPGYATSTNFLGLLIFAEVVLAAIWRYEQRFFPLLMLVFFSAGTWVPGQGFWQEARWFVLAAGAVAGLAHYVKRHRQEMEKFHLLAGFCVVAAVVSSYVSLYQQDALFKVLSLSLLFVYASTGMRAAVSSSPHQFFVRLLLFFELLTYLSATCYFILHYGFFGNPNSLGAVMGVLIIPFMLWGIFRSSETLARRRYKFALGLSVVLLATSQARAGILAACVSCAFLCIALRRYQALLVLTGVGLLAGSAVTTFAPPTPDRRQSLASTFIYKGHQEQGVFGSRKPAWEQSLSSVREHPWFGTGFGTSARQTDFAQDGNNFASADRDTREHGNSYLAILEWVGILGVWPFAALLGLLVLRVIQALALIRKIEPSSELLPLAGVVLAGLVHAAFEDWLFAVGYYLCVIFWGLAFVLADYVTQARSVSPYFPISEARRFGRCARVCISSKQ